MPAALSDEFQTSDRVYLEKLRLATSVLLDLAKTGKINGVLETELHFLRDRVDRAMLSPAVAGDILPWHESADPDSDDPDSDDDGPAPEIQPYPAP